VKPRREGRKVADFPNRPRFLLRYQSLESVGEMHSDSDGRHGDAGGETAASEMRPYDAGGETAASEMRPYDAGSETAASEMRPYDVALRCSNEKGPRNREPFVGLKIQRDDYLLWKL
jgi:hypothetical protein